jgi:plastocyanin
MATTWTVTMGSPSGPTFDPALDDKFNPSALVVRVGDAVQWQNLESGDGAENHTATSNGHTGQNMQCTPTSSEDFHLVVTPGATSPTHTFMSTGCFNYHCEFHAQGCGGTSATPHGMIGTIVVI